TAFVFKLPDPAWSFRVDDEPLLHDPIVPGGCRWEPLFFAGEVTGELVRPDGTTAGLFLLDVAPDPTKLGREIFSRMLGELWDEDPSLVIGAEPATSPIGDLGTTHNPWL